MTPFHAPNFVYPTLQIPGHNTSTLGPTAKPLTATTQPLTHTLIVPRATRKVNADSTSPPGTKSTMTPATALQHSTPASIAVLPARPSYAVHMMPQVASATHSPQQFGANIFSPFAKPAAPVPVNLIRSNVVQGIPIQIRPMQQLNVLNTNVAAKDSAVRPEEIPKPPMASNAPGTPASSSETGASNLFVCNVSSNLNQFPR